MISPYYKLNIYYIIDYIHWFDHPNFFPLALAAWYAAVKHDSPI